MRTTNMFVMCLVFLMVWKDTLQIPPENDIHLSNETRSKRYHESDERSYVSENKKNKSIKDQSNVPTELVRGSQAKLTSSEIPNKTPTRTTTIPQSKVIRVRPIIANANLPKQKPVVFYVNKNELPKRQIQSTSAVDSNSRKVKEREIEVEKIVNTTDTDKPLKIRECDDSDNNLLETNITENIDKNANELDKVTKNNTEVLDTHTNDKKKTTKTIPSKPLKNIRKSKEKHETKSKIVSENPINKNKTSRKFKTEINDTNESDASVSLETTPAVMLEKKIKKKANSTEETTTKNEDLKIIDQMKTKPTEKQVVIEHPFLKAIQNDKYLTSSPCDKPNDSINNGEDDKTDDNAHEIEIPVDTEIKDVETKISQKEEIDENEDVLVRQSKYDEFQEITYSSAFKNLQIDNVQENLKDYSSYQEPYNYCQEVSRPDNADYEFNNNQYSFNPDEQKVEQIDGATVVSYKNYYKTPKPYWNNNVNYYYPSYPYNNNGNYNRRQLSNNYGMYQHKPTPYLGDTKARIWKSWKNTDYLIKSRNALQQIRNGNIRNNSLMNPGNTRNLNNIQTKNARLGGF